MKLSHILASISRTQHSLFFLLFHMKPVANCIQSCPSNGKFVAFFCTLFPRYSIEIAIFPLRTNYPLRDQWMNESQLSCSSSSPCHYCYYYYLPLNAIHFLLVFFILFYFWKIQLISLIKLLEARSKAKAVKKLFEAIFSLLHFCGSQFAYFPMPSRDLLTLDID